MIEELEKFLEERNNGAYERDAYDRYCQKRSLSLDAPAIHVTGSNGKGSTIHYLEAIYMAAGYHVASFIKPAFFCLNECIRYDGEEISDAELLSLFQDNKKDFEKFKLSEFECSVALAYRYFNKKKPVSRSTDRVCAIFSRICGMYGASFGRCASTVASTFPTKKPLSPSRCATFFKSSRLETPS